MLRCWRVIEHPTALGARAASLPLSPSCLFLSFISDAKRQRQLALYERRREQDAAQMVRKALADVGTGDARDTMLARVKTEAGESGPLAAVEFAAVPSQVPMLAHVHAAQPHELDKCMASSTLKKQS